MRLIRDRMLDILYENEGGTVVRDRISGVSRWRVNHEFVFTVGDKFYRADYSEGTTEYQSEAPWDGQRQVECREVTPVERVVTMYEFVKRS